MSPAKSLLTFLIVAAATCLSVVPSLHGAAPNSDNQQTEVRLLFAGDILLSRGVEQQLIHDPQALSRALYPILSGADLVIGNLEGAVGSQEGCIHSARQAPCFPIREDLITLLHASAFTAIGLANNHSADLGPAARQATRMLLEKNDLVPLTYEQSPRFIRIKDLTVGVVALSMVPGRDERTVDVPGTELRQKLRVAKSISNFVVVYIHWGSEFLDWPDTKQRQAADWLIKNGADIMIGHHPHLIQKPESLHGKPVFYSLGNLVFDQKYPSTREGMLADCRIRGESVSCRPLLTRTPEGTTLPVIGGADRETEKVLSACALKLSPPLSLNGITLRPENSTKDDLSGLSLEAARNGEILWKTRHANVVSLQPMKVRGPGAAEYLFTLERHFSPFDGEEGLRPCVYEASPQGLVPKWRGTALAWPLLDAVLLPGNNGILCAQHRGDSFIAPGRGSNEKRIAAYRWKGFGFAGIEDPASVGCTADCFK
jgi:poly-gamma-glutamate synthesis protein (capsule biosynthesis protein)